LADEAVHLLVADVEAAELVERESVGGPQAQDLPVQQKVEPPQFFAQVFERVGRQASLHPS